VLAYLLKRLLAMVPTLLGITFVTFLIVNLAPGDPVATAFGSDSGGGPSAEGGGAEQDRLADAIKAKKKLLGMVTEDRTLHVWVPPASGEDLRPMEQTERVGEFVGWARSLDMAGDSLAVGSDTGELLRMGLDGEVQQTLAGHDDPIWVVRLAADGRLLSSDTGGAIKLWSPDGAELAVRPATGRPVRSLRFHPDGTRAYVASEDGSIVELSLPELIEVRRFEGHVSGVYSLALDQAGTTLWSGGYDRTLREWSLESGSLTRERDGMGAAINDLALSTDGKTLAAASDDRRIRLVSLDDFDAKAAELTGHFKPVTRVAWLGSRLVSGSVDQTVRVWDTRAGTEVFRSNQEVGRVNGLVVSGDTLVTASNGWVEVPVPLRYLRWLGRILTLDFDRSFIDDQPVMDKIAKALPITVGLNIIALTLIYLISIPLGVYAAVKRGSLFDHVSSVILFILYSIPNFWLATLLIMFFSSRQNFDWFPSVGLISDNSENLSSLQYLWDGFMHLVLPITVMVYAGFASLSRYARTSLLETIGEDYIRTARAKGLSEKVVVIKHAFRNSLITIVTLIGNLLPAMIGGSVIVEYIFSINGMGKLGFDAILARDYPLIMAITTFSAFLTLVGILVSDLLYTVVDPRVTAD